MLGLCIGVDDIGSGPFVIRCAVPGAHEKQGTA